jgi:hypothetical protein
MLAQQAAIAMTKGQMSKIAFRAPTLRSISASLIAALIGALSALPARADCAPPSAPVSQVEMFFGSSVKGRPAVSEAAWAKFLADQITPKFPDGLTVWNATGQWRSGDGKIYREATHVLLILYKPDATTEGKIEAIRDSYKKQFNQESAPLRVDSTVCAAF